MNREEIIRMAREAWMEPEEESDIVWCAGLQDLERFYHIAVAAEREACAKVCDARALKNEEACDGADADETISLRSAAWQISVCAAAIRARGQE